MFVSRINGSRLEEAAAAVFSPLSNSELKSAETYSVHSEDTQWAEYKAAVSSVVTTDTIIQNNTIINNNT